VQMDVKVGCCDYLITRIFFDGSHFCLASMRLIFNTQLFSIKIIKIFLKRINIIE
jgi:hypothetical protein